MLHPSIPKVEGDGRPRKHAYRFVPIWLKIFGFYVGTLLLAVVLLSLYNANAVRDTVRSSLVSRRNTAVLQISESMDNYFSNMLFALNKHVASTELQAAVYKAKNADDPLGKNRDENKVKTLLFEYSESVYTQRGLCSILQCEQFTSVSWQTNYPKTQEIMQEAPYCDIWRIRNPSEAVWRYGLRDPQSPFYDNQMICVYRTLYNLYTQEYYGGVMVLGRMTELESCFNEALTGGEMLVMLDDDGNTVCMSGRSEGIAPATSEALMNATGQEERLRLEGVDYFVSRADSGITGWHIFSLMPEQQAFVGLFSLQKMLYIALSLFSALTILLAFFIARGLTKPLKVLSNSMKEVEAGNLNVQIAATSNDETRELSIAYSKMLASIRQLLLEQRTREQERRKLEARFLQNQIKPHFINNSLRMLKLLIQLREWDTAKQALTAFSMVLNRITVTTSDLIPLREEMAIVNNYLRLQQIGDMSHFTYDFRIDPEAGDFPIPKLLLQPLVENCIQHAYDRISQDFTVLIEAITVHTGVVIRIRDTGIGMSRERLEQVLEGTFSKADDHGWGLNNVRARIELYYEKSRFWIHSTPGEGTCVTVYLDRPYPDDLLVKGETDDQDCCSG